MENHFATYNQSLALKKLGFDEPCLMYYDHSLKLVESGVYECLAPIKSQVFEWFREKHGLYSVIDGLEHRQYYKITQLNSCSKEYDTYEEAESACIDKLIEIIKEKK